MKDTKTKTKGKNGGARPGAGRKPGKATQATLDKMKVKAAIDKKIMKFADRLAEAQLTIALGCSYLFKKPKIGKGRPTIVTDPKVIERYLLGEFEGDKSSDYYFITTERPDNKAIDSALDRTFGTPTQSHKLEDDEGKTLGVVFLPAKQK